uniref:Ovule protein n=1 Tax=Romanomermis culicivorax TaxID=13658 RepID=A0A915IJP0_ROMCU
MICCKAKGTTIVKKDQIFTKWPWELGLIYCLLDPWGRRKKINFTDGILWIHSCRSKQIYSQTKQIYSQTKL